MSQLRQRALVGQMRSVWKEVCIDHLDNGWLKSKMFPDVWDLVEGNILTPLEESVDSRFLYPLTRILYHALNNR